MVQQKIQIKGILKLQDLETKGSRFLKKKTWSGLLKDVEYIQENIAVIKFSSLILTYFIFYGNLIIYVILILPRNYLIKNPRGELWKSIW